MAGGADGLVRRGVPGDPARGDPHHHPRQPEMLRAARPADREARQPLHPRRQHRGRRRRQGDRRRQRARDPRAAVATRSSSTRPISRRGSKTGCRSSTRSCSTRSSARRASASSASAAGREIAPLVGADVAKAKRAARLAKADLTTEMVGEFPELQGLMGRYYARRRARTRRRRRDRGSLQAAGPRRPRAHRSGGDRGRARRQARHARRLLGDRREADREQGPVCAAPGGAGRDPDHAGEPELRTLCDLLGACADLGWSRNGKPLHSFGRRSQRRIEQSSDN